MNYRSSFRHLRTITLSALALVICLKSAGQISVMGGLNYCDVRNKNLLQHQNPIFTYHFGTSVSYHPFKNLPRLSFEDDFLFTQKGYSQDLDKKYVFHFNYCSLPVLAKYTLVDYFSLHAGVELSGLLFTNIKKGTQTYRHFDTGIVAGFSFFEKRVITFYARAIYGLVPMLDYYKIDKLGNFTGNIHDLKNTCISVGLKINILDEKLNFLL